MVYHIRSGFIVIQRNVDQLLFLRSFKRIYIHNVKHRDPDFVIGKGTKKRIARRFVEDIPSWVQAVKKPLHVYWMKSFRAGRAELVGVYNLILRL